MEIGKAGEPSGHGLAGTARLQKASVAAPMERGIHRPETGSRMQALRLAGRETRDVPDTPRASPVPAQ